MARVVILPGNGGVDVEHTNWYSYVRDELRTIPGLQVVLQNMPDPVYARESVWLPFMKRHLGCDQTTVVIGHCSGAVAAMRFAETQPLHGIILVSAYESDLGDQLEQQSGYFSRPWNWAAIRNNAGFIVQFGSTDDPFIPWREMQSVADNLKTDLRKYTDRGHFMAFEFTELVDTVKECLDKYPL